MPFKLVMASTVVPYLRAMSNKVSPCCTIYWIEVTVATGVGVGIWVGSATGAGVASEGAELTMDVSF